MRLAEPDAGMDVERVEHHGIAAASFGDLTCCGMRQRVGAADDEACKGQARIERRAAERIMIGGDWRGRSRTQLRRGCAARLDRCGRFLGLLGHQLLHDLVTHRRTLRPRSEPYPG